MATLRLLAGDSTGRQVQAAHGPADLTWTEAAAALSTATGMPITAQQNTDDEQRAALHDAGMGEVAVEGIVGISIGKREGFTPRTAARTWPEAARNSGQRSSTALSRGRSSSVRESGWRTSRSVTSRTVGGACGSGPGTRMILPRAVRAKDAATSASG